ncbi:hypothetical protein AJ87_37590 [Rhizobium yanglingense]|nr:hypothetical protein AJ87_37590 [Rhizobium yanglingense]
MDADIWIFVGNLRKKRRQHAGGRRIDGADPDLPDSLAGDCPGDLGRQVDLPIFQLVYAEPRNRTLRPH